MTTVHHSHGSAQRFLDQDLPDTEASLWIHRVDVPTLVLGSAQPSDFVDTAQATQAGWAVARRRSGGGLVMVQPEAGLWVDVMVPRAHWRWEDDVNRAFWWLGRAWARTIRRACLVGSSAPPPDPITVEVHQGPLLGAEAGRSLCFAAVGPGEVLIHPGAGVDRRPTDRHGAAKVVGISQRRNRSGARFQCFVLLGPLPLIDLQLVSSTHRQAVRQAFEGQQAGWPASVPAPRLEDLEQSAITTIGAALDGPALDGAALQDGMSTPY